MAHFHWAEKWSKASCKTMCELRDVRTFFFPFKTWCCLLYCFNPSVKIVILWLSSICWWIFKMNLTNCSASCKEMLSKWHLERAGENVTPPLLCPERRKGTHRREWRWEPGKKHDRNWLLWRCSGLQRTTRARTHVATLSDIVHKKWKYWVFQCFFLLTLQNKLSLIYKNNLQSTF